MVFGIETRKWTELGMSAGWPCWSRDGRHLYALGSRDDTKDWIYRVRIRDRRVEKLVSVKEIPRPTTRGGQWMGLAPDDSPLVLQELSIEEIYALEWEAP